MKAPVAEAHRIWTTMPRREWAEELQKFPPMNEAGRKACSREDVREALRLALSALDMGGTYQGMTAENRFVASAGFARGSREGVV